MERYEIHEIANYLPEMTKSEYEHLKEAISAVGVLDPIILLNGKILDGRHRYKACCELGIECPTRHVSNASPNDVVEMLNIARRHLTPSQIAMVMAKLREPFEKEAKFRQEATRNENINRKDDSGKMVKPVSANLHSQGSINTKQILAQKSGVGERTISDAIKIDKHGTDEEKKSVINGQRTVSSVAKEIRQKEKIIVDEKKETSTMNTTNDNIGWAQYSWNPVVGCKFGCDYCYAEEICNRYFGGKFNEPKFHKERLGMPGRTKPRKSDLNNRVFVCSMGELFGDWVDQEWIDQVMDMCRNNEHWTFLFLTKNPKRLPTIDFPENSWIGSTIDIQKREQAVANAFYSMHNKKLFISCEPLLEEITLSEKLLKCLNLIIIGSKSNGSSKTQPDPKWVEKLLWQARDHNIAVWFKDNLIFRPQEEI